MGEGAARTSELRRPRFFDAVRALSAFESNPAIVHITFAFMRLRAAAPTAFAIAGAGPWMDRIGIRHRPQDHRPAALCRTRRPSGWSHSLEEASARIASFDRRPIAAAKNLINQVSLPSADRLLDGLNSFLTALTWPETQQRIQALLKRGLQQDSDFEKSWPEVLDTLLEPR